MKILLPLTIGEIALAILTLPVRCSAGGYFSLSTSCGAIDLRLYGLRLAAIRLSFEDGRLKLTVNRKEKALPPKDRGQEEKAKRSASRVLQSRNMGTALGSFLDVIRSAKALKDDLTVSVVAVVGCGDAMYDAIVSAALSSLFKSVSVYPQFAAEALEVDGRIKLSSSLVKTIAVVLETAAKLAKRRMENAA